MGAASHCHRYNNEMTRLKANIFWIKNEVSIEFVRRLNILTITTNVFIEYIVVKTLRTMSFLQDIKI